MNVATDDRVLRSAINRQIQIDGRTKVLRIVNRDVVTVYIENKSFQRETFQTSAAGYG